MTTYNSTNPNVTELYELCEPLTSQQTIEVVKIMREELQKREQKEREILEPIWEPFLTEWSKRSSFYRKKT